MYFEDVDTAFSSRKYSTHGLIFGEVLYRDITNTIYYVIFFTEYRMVGFGAYPSHRALCETLINIISLIQNHDYI